MFCNKCGYKLGEGDNFCPKCGAKRTVLDEAAKVVEIPGNPKAAEPAGKKKIKLPEIKKPEISLPKIKLNKKTIIAAAAALLAVVILILALGGKKMSDDYSYSFTDFSRFVAQDAEASQRLGRGFNDFMADQFGMHWLSLQYHYCDMGYFIELVDRYIESCLVPEGFKLMDKGWESSKYAEPGYEKKYVYTLKYAGGGLENPDGRWHMKITVSMFNNEVVGKDYTSLGFEYSTGLTRKVDIINEFTGPERYFEENGGPGFRAVDEESVDGIIRRDYVLENVKQSELVQQDIEDYIWNGLGREGFWLANKHSDSGGRACSWLLMASYARGVESHVFERDYFPEQKIAYSMEIYLFYNEAMERYELELNYIPRLDIQDNDISHSYEPTPAPTPEPTPAPTPRRIQSPNQTAESDSGSGEKKGGALQDLIDKYTPEATAKPDAVTSATEIIREGEEEHVSLGIDMPDLNAYLGYPMKVELFDELKNYVHICYDEELSYSELADYLDVLVEDYDFTPAIEDRSRGIYAFDYFEQKIWTLYPGYGYKDEDDVAFMIVSDGGVTHVYYSVDFDYGGSARVGSGGTKLEELVEKYSGNGSAAATPAPAPTAEPGSDSSGCDYCGGDGRVNKQRIEPGKNGRSEIVRWTEDCIYCGI